MRAVVVQLYAIAVVVQLYAIDGHPTWVGNAFVRSLPRPCKIDRVFFLVVVKQGKIEMALRRQSLRHKLH